MKNKIEIFLIFILIIPNILRTQTIPTYTLIARNLFLIAPDSLTFDIFLRHTNFPTPFIYSQGQYYLNFNPNFGNGGTLTFSMLESEMDTSCRPRNPTVINGILRIATNTFPGIGMGCEISHTGPGTLVGRFSLTTTTNFLPLDSSYLKWRNIASGNPYTNINAYVGNTIVDITDSSGHYVDFNADVSENINPLKLSVFKLYQNFPNPFNPKTIISYELRVTGYVKLKVFDVNGKEIVTLVNEKQNGGEYKVEWDAGEYSSGIYFYRFQTENYSEVKKMVLKK